MLPEHERERDLTKSGFKHQAAGAAVPDHRRHNPAAGLGSAGVVYWLGSHAKDYADDLSMVGFNRAEERQMAILYGKQGQLIEDLENSLKQSGTQASLIAAAAAVIAIGCFYFARILEDEARQAELDGPQHV